MVAVINYCDIQASGRYKDKKRSYDGLGIEARALMRSKNVSRALTCTDPRLQ